MGDLWTPASYQDRQSGYNMPGGSGVEDDRPGVSPGGGGFWDRIKAKTADVGGRMHAAGNAWGDVQQQRMRSQYPSTTSPEMSAALGAYDPTGKAEEDWNKTKWAFRGTHTTHTHSLAREQNVYGGVQRTQIPTERISLQQKRIGWEQHQGDDERGLLNYEEMYPPGAPGSQPPPMGMSMGQGPPQQAAGMPMGSGPPSQSMSADPLFAKNTGQLPFNAAQFGTAHQRMTAGSP